MIPRFFFSLHSDRWRWTNLPHADLHKFIVAFLSQPVNGLLLRGNDLYHAKETQKLTADWVRKTNSDKFYILKNWSTSGSFEWQIIVSIGQIKRFPGQNTRSLIADRWRRNGIFHIVKIDGQLIGIKESRWLTDWETKEVFNASATSWRCCC